MAALGLFSRSLSSERQQQGNPVRHLIRYNSEGELVGVDRRMGGWPDDVDPNDPETTNPRAQKLRKTKATSGANFVGWASYRCPCPEHLKTCTCAHHVCQQNYYNGVVIFPKPELRILVNDVEVADLASVVPGSNSTLKLVGAIPDGHAVTVHDIAATKILSSDDHQVSLTFSGGESDPVEFVAPDQGMSATLAATSKYVRYFILNIRGWA